MSKLIMLLIGMNMVIISVNGQNLFTLSGRILDEHNQPLPGTSVFLTPSDKGTITNVDGYYFINGIKKGIYTVKVSFIGYKPQIDTININQNKIHNIQMAPSSLTLMEVVITDHSVETRKKEESLNIEIVNNRYLKQNLGGSLMQSLERLPGVATIDIGSGQSKPVIRGLGFNRVVVVENDIKHEAQQWGADHGLEIDQYAIDNVEIIKGPASLIYGSDAMGGVIDMKNRKLPADSTYGGSVDLSGKTNNDFVGTSVLLYGRKKWLFADFRATLLDYGDYKVPTETVDVYGYKPRLYKNHLRNTAGKEQDLHFSLGIIQKRFQTRFFISNVNSKSGFFANAHGLEPIRVNTLLYDKSARDIQYPYHTVNHFKAINSSSWQGEKIKLDLNLGFQRNYMREKSKYIAHGSKPPVFPDTLSFPGDLELEFDKFIYSGNVKATHEVSELTRFTYGANAEFMDNGINGVNFLIPAFLQYTLGGYVLVKHALNPNSFLQAGLRYDYGKVKTREYFDWFKTDVIDKNGNASNINLQRAYNLDLHFQNLSWSVGYNYFNDRWLIKLNAGKSYRMPTPQELAANGINSHFFRYEIGDSAINPEISYQLDVGLEVKYKKFVFGISPFANYFTNYIYLNPTPNYDRDYGAGNQIFQYEQSRVFRYGGEIHSHYQIIEPLQVGLIGEYVYSEQQSGEKKGFTLPFSPPASAILNVKYQKQKIKCIENAYLSVDYKLTAPQNNIVPPEETTVGYQVINVGLGGDVKLKNQKISVTLQVKNLLNTKYFNHTSYYRLINVPEPGRNFIMNISIPFSDKIKQK